MSKYEFFHNTTIQLGTDKMDMSVTYNAPVVINFYRVNGKKKVYNTDKMKMHYTTDDCADWRMGILNNHSGRDVWYRAN